jgi:light-regulated signal transduction histidine kinase (bacteriophytochrome)
MDHQGGAKNGDAFREFLLRACHDLRGPLRGIRANAELLCIPEKRAGPDVEQILGFVVAGAKRMECVVDGLAGYTLALHTGEGPFLPTNLGVVLRSAIARLGSEIRESGGEVSYGELPRLTGDPDRLTQLFENLLRNALQCRGSAPPRIQVTATAQDSAWLIAVRDNGRGIDAADAERIFKPFERLRRDGSEGAGLGLAACREIVTRHGGKIWAQRQTESGATIFLTLPAGPD